MSNIAILSFYSGIIERGVETFVLEISRRIQNQHKVTVIQAGTPKYHKFKIVKIKTFASPPRSNKGLLAKLYLDFQSLRILLFSILAISYIVKNRFNLIIPLNGGWQTLIYRVISKVIGAKILVSGHAGIGADDASNLLFRPDIFVALTSAEASWAQKLAPEVRTVIIPNGVDLSRFNPKVVARKLPLAKPIVICSSALVPYKRVDLTIKALAKTKNLSLLILGDGQESGAIDSLGKRLLGKRYLHLVVPYQEIPSYYRAGQVFSLASRTEAFGISYIEAMACNLPVVTTSDDSRAEIIGNAGILTDPRNIHEYAKDLELAAKINWRNKPYTQALNFSWNKIAEKYSSLIDEITSRKS